LSPFSDQDQFQLEIYKGTPFLKIDRSVKWCMKKLGYSFEINNMNDLIEFLELMAVKNTPEIQSFFGSSIENINNITGALVEASPHLDAVLEAVVKSGMLNLII
jgi:hypothetical protein